MPLRNEHAARQRPPDEFVRFFRKYLTLGVAAVMGVDGKGKARIQSIRFDKHFFTPDAARMWLARHGFRTAVEEAREDVAAHP